MKRSILLVMILGACKQAPAGGSEDGADVYARMCTTCHGSYGKPSASMAARLGVRDLTSQELRARVTPALVEQQVRKGSANKLMPGFEGVLTDDQLRAVSAYVASPTFLERR